MTDNEPRVLITAIKCQKCDPADYNGHTIFLDGAFHHYPFVRSADYVRDLAATLLCAKCRSHVRIATEPVPTSHLVGGHEFLHTIGYGHLGEYDPATGERTASPTAGGERD